MESPLKQLVNRGYVCNLDYETLEVLRSLIKANMAIQHGHGCVKARITDDFKDVIKPLEYIVRDFMGGDGRVIVKDETNSTMDDAKEYMTGKNWCIVVAETQRGGRGRYGRAWYSPKGGLWFTIGLKLHSVNIQLTSIIVGLTITMVLEKLCKLNLGILWPNDIILEGKKLCGILVENRLTGDVTESFIGVGLNVNNRVRELPEKLRDKAISLSEVLGFKVPRATLFLILVDHIIDNLLRQERVNMNSLRKYDISVGRRVVLKVGSNIVEGVSLGISESGTLRVKVGNEILELNSVSVIYLEGLKYRPI